ncbi:MAG TPA: aminotransferase class V-fold PLP-dependent enzyme [Candidatus Nanopelagicaceae bacterium]|jgi:kynureninase|nr:aminotransferase class V-fold PLP-dependent enzyme [Candidatus Nanopelagicaceae bacterium]
MERTAALELDAQDPLREFKNRFVITDPDTCYLDGNSLGRLPHATVKAINDFLTQEWGPEVVAGWGHWVDEAQSVGDLIGRSALGAGPGQVLACDTTSVNFYQLASAAIRARPDRKTIIIDAANFPTDRYIMQGLANQLGLKLITIDNEDPTISDHELITPEILKKYMSDDVALVSLEVVQYRSGARQDIKAINELVKSFGALMLWDAAHAIGSVAMDFDKNGVELAVGCTYKYGNSGPGAPAWLYVSKQMQNELRVPIQGWFAQRDQFAMGPTFERDESIRGFQIASPSLMGLRCIKTSFEMIEEAGIAEIEKKAARGTAMMIELYEQWLAPLGFTLNTPRNHNQRGGHISLVHPEAEKIAIALRKFANVIPDYRVPNSIRVAISPLATSYVEVYDGFQRIRDLVSTRQYEKVTTGGSRVT